MGVFKYTTLAAIRAEAITTGQLADDRAKVLIERVSREINELTQQWFVPVAKRLELDGRGGFLAYAEIPVLHVDELEIVPERSKDPGIGRVGAVEPSYVLGFSGELPKFDDRYSIASPFRPATMTPDYTIEDRKIRAMVPFPEGLNNVRVDGFFGWTQDRQDFRTTLAADLAPNDTGCTLADASGVRPGHVLTFTTGACLTARTEFTAWVASVSGAVVTFVEPATDLGVTLAHDTTRVADFGSVPVGIQYATLLMVNRQKSGIGTAMFSEEEFYSRLKSERTDNYSYTLQPQTEVTGDDTVNNLLNQYVRPPFVSVV